MEPQDAARQSRLAASGLADQGEGLAAADLERHVGDRMNAVAPAREQAAGPERKLLHHMLDAQQRLRGPGRLDRRGRRHRCACSPLTQQAERCRGWPSSAASARRFDAALDRLRAPRLKRAPRRRGDQAGRLTRNRREPDPLQIRAWEGAEESARVGMVGRSEQLLARRDLHGSPGVHHDHVVGHLGDDPEVVRDQDHSGTELPLHAA